MKTWEKWRSQLPIKICICQIQSILIDMTSNEKVKIFWR